MKSAKERWIGWMVFENDKPKRFYPFKRDALESCCGTRADNTEIWIREVIISSIQEERE